MFSDLTKTSIFKGMESSEITHLLDSINYRLSTFEPENVIAYASDKSENLYILLKGSVRGEMIGYNDKSIVISEIHAPDTFAEGFLFANKNKLLINVIANTNAELIIVSKHELLKLLNNHPKMLDNYLSTISNRFVTVTEKLRFLMLNTVKKKLANYILDLEKKNMGKKSFKLGKTHEELAAFFAITRPALTHNLLKLKTEKLIEIHNKEIRIIDKEGLIKLLN